MQHNSMSVWQGVRSADGIVAIPCTRQLSSGPVAQSVRKHILSSYRVFRSLCDKSIPYLTASPSLVPFAEVAVKHSEQLRMELKNLMVDLDNILQQLSHMSPHNSMVESVNMEEDEIIRRHDAVKSIEKVWHLCEIFHINPTKYLSLEFARWLVESGTPIHGEYITEAVKIMRDLGSHHCAEAISSGRCIFYEGKQAFWDFMFNLALWGQVTDMWVVLECHPEIEKILQSKGGDHNFMASLKEIIQEHPYAKFVNPPVLSVVDENPQYSISDMKQAPSQIAIEFKQWNTKLSNLVATSSGLSVLTRIRELDTLVKILLGDDEIMKKVVQSCNLGANTDDLSQILTLSKLLYRYPPPLTKANLLMVVEEANECFRRNGDSLSERMQELRGVIVGDVANIILNIYKRQTDFPPGEVSLVSLVATAHLLQLLVHAGDMTDFVQILPYSSCECSFPELVFLESAQILNEFGYPVSLVGDYLQLCPTNGIHFAKALLPKRPISSDKEALELSASLRKLNLNEEAEVVEIARGTWWLQTSRCGRKGGVTKALFFYQQAGDTSRSIALLDRAAYRCFAAVRACSDIFPGLTLHPSPPRGHRWRAEGPDLTDMPTSFYNVSASQGSPSSSSTLSPSGGLFNVNCRQALEDARSEASEMLALLITSTPLIEGTKFYISNYLEALQLILLSDEELMFRKLSKLQALKEAGRLLCELVNPGVPPKSPLRYWLHIMDLATWLDTAAAQLWESVVPENQLNWPHTIYSKAQAYSIMQALEHLLNSYVADDLKAGATDTELQALREKLLKIFAASVIQDNAETGKAKQERQEAIMKEKLRSEARHRQKTQLANDAYDILTARVFR